MKSDGVFLEVEKRMIRKKFITTKNRCGRTFPSIFCVLSGAKSIKDM